MIIDLHAHQLTKDMFKKHDHWGPFWENGTLRIGDWVLGTKRPSSISFDELYDLRWNPKQRVVDMDRCGIEKFVVTMPFHMVMYHTDPKWALSWAQNVNDSLAGFCSEAPDRLYFWAHVPAQDPVAAAGELERAVKDLGAKGISMGGANFGGKEVYDEAFNPLWEKACELGVPIFVHGYNQSVNWGDKAMDDPYDTTSICGMNSDETLFYWWMTNAGVLDRFPQLKLLITHGGGFVPFQLRRFNETNKTMAPDSKNKLDLVEYGKNFFFDLDIHSPHMRRAIVEEVGVDQMLYGDNFGGADSHEGDLTEGMGLSEEDREKIRSGNTLKL